MKSLRDQGLWPWWTVDGFKLALFRPLDSLWHALDYRVWPNAHWFMHAESILVFAATAFFAALLYRRLLGATVAAGIAALIFAVDDAHSTDIGWVANRHAVLSTLFGVLALVAHDRARRDGWKPGVFLAPLALLGAVFSGESGLSALAYLFAYALFLDRAPLRSRAVALLPHVGVALVWFAAYKLGRYGAAGGAFYIDPLRQTGAFIRAVGVRLPVLLAGQMAAPRADVWILWPPNETRSLVSICLLVLLVVGGGIFAVLRRDRNAAFFALGMVLSLLPACAVWPSDRLLLFAGIDGAEGRTLVVVSAPDSMIVNTVMAAWVNETAPLPSALRVLSTAVGGTLKVGRADDRTLSVTLSDGFFRDPMATVFRDMQKAPLRMGDRVPVGAMVAEIVSVTEDGKLPSRVDFHFDRSLDDPSIVWVVWEKTRFVPFVAPKVGETRDLVVVSYQTAVGG
ncbi:hypothetical protein KEG38_49140 [Polyangium jinanense]|uniref:hypothetical protein n=1 Tax=Polyangium jinanense TaxID=2829994 RepID=UPI0023425FF6|nr:hypothetical protein [Polyangium jinanense]MDC3954768.1 hypothetical protein [Polyangium jinanense]MDC3961883.1 hypothetical protein [Polyangium jinanense]